LLTLVAWRNPLLRSIRVLPTLPDAGTEVAAELLAP
jgi:hypothetical protein